MQNIPCYLLQTECNTKLLHYNDVIMSAMTSQVTSLAIVYSTVYSGTDERTHQSSASLAFVRGIHQWPVNSPHKGPVSWKMFPLDDVIIVRSNGACCLPAFAGVTIMVPGPVVKSLQRFWRSGTRRWNLQVTSKWVAVIKHPKNSNNNDRKGANPIMNQSSYSCSAI